ncbi:MAG TPA: cupin domain-containing protein [Dongiaceae bacterium]|nr:cupin domain-containing protein [Dongiaceae bacterium]
MSDTYDDPFDITTVARLSLALSPKELPTRVINDLAANIQSRIRKDSLVQTRSIRREEGDWNPWFNDIEIKMLHQDPERNRQTALWRLHPGAVIPAHEHHGDEECLVLEGEIESGGLVLRTGDFHFAQAGGWHAPIRSQGGALLLISSDLIF